MMKYIVVGILGGSIGFGLSAATDSWWILFATFPLGIVIGCVASLMFDRYSL